MFPPSPWTPHNVQKTLLCLPCLPTPPGTLPSLFSTPNIISIYLAHIQLHQAKSPPPLALGTYITPQLTSPILNSNDKIAAGVRHSLHCDARVLIYRSLGK